MNSDSRSQRNLSLLKSSIIWSDLQLFCQFKQLEMMMAMKKSGD